MELHYLLLTGFSILIGFLLNRQLKKQSSAKNLPPGPPKLPIIGNLHQLVRGSLPFRVLRDLSNKYGPLIHLQMGEVSTVIVSSAEMAREVTRTHDLAFASRPQRAAFEIVFYGEADYVAAPFGDYWRQMRKLLMTELLSVKNVKSYRSIREDEASNLVSSIRSSTAKGLPVNLTNQLVSLACGVLCRSAFGKRCSDQDAFIELMFETLALSGGFGIADMFPSIKLIHLVTRMRPQLLKIHRKLDKVLENIIKEHCANDAPGKKRANGEFGSEDIIDVLLRLKESDGLDVPITNTHIKALIMDMFTGGTESSATTVVWAMTELITNPQVLEKAQAEVRQVLKGKTTITEDDIQGLNYLKLVIKETLRLHPAAPVTSRECREDCEIEGYKIPKTTMLIINIWAIGRDPTYWQNPERFEPERFLNTNINYSGTDSGYIPFGAGRRMCPGYTFALATIELPLANLLFHFDWKLPGEMKPEDLDMTETPGLTARKLDHLILEATPYND